jgi:hypothetical protein
MRVVVIYKDNTEYARTVTDFLRDFYRQTGHELETLDPDEREGASFCQAYDIIEYPAIIAVSDDGVLQQLWKGLPFPTISEVSYYV